MDNNSSNNSNSSSNSNNQTTPPLGKGVEAIYNSSPVMINGDIVNFEAYNIDGYKEDIVSSLACLILGSVAVLCGLFVGIAVWLR